MSQNKLAVFFGLGLTLAIGALASHPTGAGAARPEAQEKLPRDAPKKDPLPSWADGPNKQAILEFVRKVTDKSGPAFVAPADRIATFDNDGTLWVEQPMYTQVAFAADRVRALAPEQLGWTDKAPFKPVLAGDRKAIVDLRKKDWEQIVLAPHTGMTTAEFRQIAKDWLATARQPRFKRPYTACVYQPMLEVMKYLRANGFKTYIVTGGGQEFVRAFSDQAYGVSIEHVIGTAIRTKYAYKDGRPVLLRLPVLLLLDDEDGKTEDIELFIGKKPSAAFSNS